jgi:hypothetical protein
MMHPGPDATETWVSAADARGWGALLARELDRLLIDAASSGRS